MFRRVGVQAYKDGHGYRLTFVAEVPVFLCRGRGLPRIFVPEGGQVEVSVVNLPPTLEGREVAVTYGGEFIIRRGPTLTAEEVLRKVSSKA
jgi:hypothetical protein